MFPESAPLRIALWRFCLTKFYFTGQFYYYAMHCVVFAYIFNAYTTCIENWCLWLKWTLLSKSIYQWPVFILRRLSGVVVSAFVSRVEVGGSSPAGVSRSPSCRNGSWRRKKVTGCGVEHVTLWYVDRSRKMRALTPCPVDDSMAWQACVFILS